MSYRWQLFELPVKANWKDEKAALELFGDAESASWRLFIQPSFECVDLSLAMMTELHNLLSEALEGIKQEPETYNAEQIHLRIYNSHECRCGRGHTE